MTNRELRTILSEDLFDNRKASYISWFYKKYIQPNTNCVYLARRMCFFYSKGKLGKLLSKLYYLKILRKYNCCIFPEADIKEGFCIKHPVGIVIGKCTIGKHLTISQNCTIGSITDPKTGEELVPSIGNNVIIGANCVIQGKVIINDNTVIEPNSSIISK